jgi:hypothetical protein
LSPGVHLVVMPIARVTLNSPIMYANRIVFYPPGWLSLASLNLDPNAEKANPLAVHHSLMSRVDEQTLQQHSTVVFPATLDWELLLRATHKDHMELIRLLSDHVDDTYLNLIRYHQCTIEPVDALPGRAGQLDSDHMMSGALLYNAARQRGRMIGGAAFTHFITKGLGLPIESLESESFPADGEVGTSSNTLSPSTRHCWRPIAQPPSLSRPWRCWSLWPIPMNIENSKK